MKYLLAELGSPELDMEYIHIAGTNGKGSNSFMISALLREAGYRVGRFISPHIHSYCERYVVDEQEISGELLLDYLGRIEGKVASMQARGLMRPTEFEILTAVAFQYFKDKKVEIVVLEVGMGGLYDSTNVVTPRVSVITGIDYDHISFLGDSLEAIAANKAGIIKPNVPVVLAAPMPETARQVFEREARRQQAPVFYSSTVEITAQESPGIIGRKLDLKLPGMALEKLFFPLLGEYQLINLATALTAVIALGDEVIRLNQAIIRDGLARLHIPGRMELMSDEPPVILDAAHNPQAARALADSLSKLFPDRQKVLLCGVLDDKDAQNIIEYLTAGTRLFIVTRPAGTRNRRWQRLKDLIEQISPGTPVFLEEDIDRAVDLGKGTVKKEEYLVITGSFYVLDQARRHLTKG